MSLRFEESESIPEKTVRVARAAVPKGNRSIEMRDVLGQIYDDVSFAPLFSRVEASGFRPHRCFSRVLAWGRPVTRSVRQPGAARAPLPSAPGTAGVVRHKRPPQ